MPTASASTSTTETEVNMIGNSMVRVQRGYIQAEQHLSEEELRAKVLQRLGMTGKKADVDLHRSGGMVSYVVTSNV